MDIIIRQMADSHGFVEGHRHVEILGAKPSHVIPRVGDTVWGPKFPSGMTVRKIEFAYERAPVDTLSTVVVWVS